MKKNKGFTLIEAMMMLSILAVLYTIGVSSFKDSDGNITIDVEKLKESLPCNKAKSKPAKSNDEGYTIN